MGNVIPAKTEFSLDDTRYDRRTFLGRAAHQFENIDPRLLFVSDEKLKTALDLLDQFKAGTVPPTVTNEDLWEAKRVKDAVLHPDTHEKLPLYGRMAGFIPCNIPIVGGMVLSGSGLGAQVFWQWANQTYNSAFNYANRNATAQSSDSEVAMSYMFATSVAVAMSVGLQRWAASAKMSPLIRSVVQRTVPFVAVATAGSANAIAMRYKEAVDGVELVDEHGQSYGRSVVAGRVALAQVAATRVALPLPIILLPPFIIDFISNLSPVARALGKMPRLSVVINLSVITGCLAFAFPGAVALFPQEASLTAAALEPKFQNVISPVTGLPVTTFYFNKGV